MHFPEALKRRSYFTFRGTHALMRQQDNRNTTIDENLRSDVLAGVQVVIAHGFPTSLRRASIPMKPSALQRLTWQIRSLWHSQIEVTFDIDANDIPSISHQTRPRQVESHHDNQRQGSLVDGGDTTAVDVAKDANVSRFSSPYCLARVAT